MRLLLDECLHPRVALMLTRAGLDVVTVADLGKAGSPDTVVLATAAEEDRLLVTLDTDFGELLVRGAFTAPSVLLIRRRDHRAESITAVVMNVLASSSDALLSGAPAVVGERTVRLRELPLTT